MSNRENQQRKAINAMNKRTGVIVVATLVLATLAPAPASASEPPAVGQTVGLDIVYVPPGVELEDPEGGMGTNGTVWGTCGWASMWVFDAGVATARFEADAGTTEGIIVQANWIIDWVNVDNGAGGAWSGTTHQFSPTWGVDRTGWTGTGLVWGTLRSLVVTHLNGVVCAGLVPSDWEQVT